MSMIVRRILPLICNKKFPINCYSTNVVPLVTQTTLKYHPSLSIVLSDPTLIKENKKVNILDVPISINRSIFEIPKVIIPFEDNFSQTVIEDPTKVIEKKAARLIVIRRRKMKRHKLKKLRIRMKFAWSKVRQRREAAKEKAFKAELMGQIKEAQKFNAVEYVQDKLAKVKYDPKEKRWDSYSPEKTAYLKNEIAQKERFKKLKEESLESRKNINLNASDYKF